MSQAADAQLQSPLFQLPREIRDKIYYELYAEEEVTVVRSCRNECANSAPESDNDSEDENRFRGRFGSPCTTKGCQLVFMMDIYRARPVIKIPTALLQTCRRSYYEAGPIFWRSVMFVVTGFDDADLWLHGLGALPKAALQRLTIHVRQEYEFGFLESMAQLQPSWDAVCGHLASMSVKDIRLGIHSEEDWDPDTLWVKNIALIPSPCEVQMLGPIGGEGDQLPGDCLPDGFVDYVLRCLGDDILVHEYIDPCSIYDIQQVGFFKGFAELPEWTNPRKCRHRH